MWGAGEPRRRVELPVTGARALDALAFRGRRDKAGLARAAAAMRGAVRHHPSNVTAELTRDEIQAVIEAGTTGARDRHVISAALRVVDAMKERPTAPVSKKRSVVSAAKRKGPIAPIAERATPDTSVVPKRTAVRRRGVYPVWVSDAKKAWALRSVGVPRSPPTRLVPRLAGALIRQGSRRGSATPAS